MLDLVYKGCMNITPINTWTIKNLAETLKINADDVSVISEAAKNTLNFVHVPDKIHSDTSRDSLKTDIEPQKIGRKRKQIAVSPSQSN